MLIRDVIEVYGFMALSMVTDDVPKIFDFVGFIYVMFRLWRATLML